MEEHKKSDCGSLCFFKDIQNNQNSASSTSRKKYTLRERQEGKPQVFQSWSLCLSIIDMVHIKSAVFYKTKTLLEHSQLYSMKYSSTQGRYNNK